jgi:hypothetical protein
MKQEYALLKMELPIVVCELTYWKLRGRVVVIAIEAWSAGTIRKRQGGGASAMADDQHGPLCCLG